MRRIHVFRTALLPCLLLFSASFCAAEDIKKIHPTGYVTDLAGVIDPDTKTRLEALCAEVEQKTGAQMAIVTVQSLEGESVENYAVDLFKQLGVGSKKDNRGVLLLVASNERKYRIEVGYGLEPVINDARAGDTGRAMVTYLRQRGYGPASRGSKSEWQREYWIPCILGHSWSDYFLSCYWKSVWPRWTRIAWRRIRRQRLALVSAGNAGKQQRKALGRQLGRWRFRRRR